jgi:hypothetical protein
MARRMMHRHRIPARIARFFTKVSGTLLGTWMIIVFDLINPLLAGETFCWFFTTVPTCGHMLGAGCPRNENK